MNSNGSRRHNRPLPSSKNPHFQNEAKCTTFLVKMSFICMRMKNHFNIKGWTLNLVLIQRLGGTREWPIRKHISNIQPARLAEGIWCTKCHSSLPNIYFRLSGLIPPNRCHTAPKCGTAPIRYVTLHNRDRLGAASIRHRNRAARTVLVCEQKFFLVWFSWRRKSYLV